MKNTLFLLVIHVIKILMSHISSVVWQLSVRPGSSGLRRPNKKESTVGQFPYGISLKTG